MDITTLLNGIKGQDKDVMAQAVLRQKSLFKPMGSLGVLEDISIKLAGITGKVKNSTSKRILFLFGADNGIYEEGVSGSPKELTKILMNNYAEGYGCGINVICNNYGVDLKLVDMGIADNVIHKNVDNKNLMPNGTYNFAKRPAMDRDILLKAISIGVDYAKYAYDNKYDIIGNGEVGMANTTTATACIIAACGYSSINIDDIVGRGGGLDDKGLIKKKSVITTSLDNYKLSKDDPLRILECVGGLDIAAMVGLYLGAAYYRLPIVIDGLISVAAALITYRLNKDTVNFMLPSHISAEPSYNIAIKELGLKPVLNLEMRLGEGSGCPIAMGVIDTACAVMNNMTTFEEMRVEGEYRSRIKMK